MSPSANSQKQPLRIAMMTGTVGLGGAEMVVLQLTQELRSRGHTVFPVLPLGQEGWLIDELEKDGFEVHRYDLRRPIDGTLPARLAAQLDALRVDVAHSHEFVMAVYGAAATLRIQIPHVITMHGNQITADRLRRRIAMRWAFRRSHATIAVSQDTRRDMELRLGLRPGIIDVIPNGIPEATGNRERTRKAIGVRDDEILLLSVGNLSPRKAHWVLLDALVLLRESADLERVRLAIAGEGEERSRLQRMIADYSLSDRVQLLGRRGDIADLQAAADVFVLPSLWEGLPLAVLEAMFGGNPVIASDKSGIPEAVDQGVHGLLTPPGDSAALAGAIQTLVRDPALRKKMGEAARERARREFTIGAMADRYEQRYYSGLHSPRRNYQNRASQRTLSNH